MGMLEQNKNNVPSHDFTGTSAGAARGSREPRVIPG